MLIQIPPPGILEVPEGKFQAVCKEAYEVLLTADNPPRRMLRIIWELPDVTVNGIPCRVSKKYYPSLDETSVLRRDLRSWFGQNFAEGVFDSDSVIAKAATVTVKHWRKPGGDRVFRHVIKVEPPAIAQVPADVVGGH